MEDVDLCERIWDLGLRSVYLPTTEVSHIGASTTQRFSLIRVRGYHISPLYYFTKRGKDGAVIILKLIFTVELLSKSMIRRVINIVRQSDTLAQQFRAEWQVLKEVWAYSS